jgi:hypothetical protein
MASELVLQPLAGHYTMLTDLEFTTGGLRYRAITNQPFSTGPVVEVFEDTLSATIALSGAPPYEGTIPLANGLDAELTLTSADSLGSSFSIAQALFVEQVAPRAVMKSPRADVSVEMDSTAAGVDRVAVLGSPFVPPSDGLPDGFLQLSDVFHVAFDPPTASPLGRIRIGCEADSAAFESDGAIIVFHWDGGWAPLATSFSRADGSASADLQASGHYAVFLNPAAVTTDVPRPRSTGQLELHLSPNPSRGATTISFVIPRAAPVSLRVFDLQGRLVAAPVDAVLAEGRHEVRWNPDAGENAGLYFVQLVTEGRTVTRRFVVIR